MKKIFLTIITIGFSITGISKNRINAPVDKAKRCVGSNHDKDSCESMRLKAVEINCINKEEYETLKRYGAYPSCNILKQGTDKFLDGWCPCGCFHPDTLIASYDTIKEKYKMKTAKEVVKEQNNTHLVHLGKNSSINNISYKKSKIRLSTSGKEEKEMLVIETKDYPPLILTEKHPVVISSGEMITAKNLKETHLLLNTKGEKIKILKISKKKYDLDVVNFSTEREHPLEHIIVANGLLTGDQYWQASLEDQFNRVVIRQ
jgi:hypothetical protein